MDIQKEWIGMLDLVICPGFSVKDNLITAVNPAAAALLLAPGIDVRTLLLTGSEEYADFQGGCLSLKLNLTENGMAASVFRRDGTDLFLMEQTADDAVLQAMGLAARELRRTMTGAMIAADQLSRQESASQPKNQESLSRLNRSLHQLLRLVGNMADAGSCASLQHQQLRDIGRVTGEILEKAQSLTDQAGITLHWDPMPEQILTLLDDSLLERALLNMLSNAIRFSRAGGTIHVCLRQCRQMLRLSVQDDGCGIPEPILGTLFQRYLRQPCIEDSRFGLGLGMVLIRSAAYAHGGTVLIDQPEQGGTRITMTLAIRQAGAGILRSPMAKIDYAGDRDHALLELSDCLPSKLYQK